MLWLLACTTPPTPAPTAVAPTPPVPTPVPEPTPTPQPAPPTPVPPTPPPQPPAGLTLWLTGNADDAVVTPTGPGLILMGGGVEPDEAFTWWQPHVAGGDVVVLRTSGADGYNDYLYSDIGGVDSVETLLVDTVGLANDPYVRYRLETAEAIFMAGGDQATYLEAWKGTGVEDGLHAAWSRGAVIGGTSAGLAVLGDRVFSAVNGTVYSHEALEDPFNPYMTFEDDFLVLPPLQGWITDSHFAERHRHGRLVGFLARWAAQGVPRYGLGVDESTALVVGPDGVGTVVGTGRVTVMVADREASVLQPGAALEMEVGVAILDPGDTLSLPDGAGSLALQGWVASGGALTTP